MARMTRERFDEATEQDMRNFFATLSENCTFRNTVEKN